MTERFIVAVGSTRQPKLDAVRDALALMGERLFPVSSGACDSRLPPAIETLGLEVPSGVRHTPLSREDTMLGARQRAETLVRIAREKGEHWKFFVGLEGGIDIVNVAPDRLALLQNWAYVTDGAGPGSFGQSGSVALPGPLARRVVDEGVELSDAIDEYAGKRGIRDGEGAWGILTDGLITRRDAFRIAVVNAFAPFLTRAGQSALGRVAT
jgi:non-canonical (house-cleaning) NTP pyrophosphatase